MKYFMFLFVFLINISYSYQNNSIKERILISDLNHIYKVLNQYTNTIESNIKMGKKVTLINVPVYKSSHKKIAEIEYNYINDYLSVNFIHAKSSFVSLSSYVKSINYTPYILEKSKAVKYYYTGNPTYFSYWNCDIYLYGSKRDISVVFFSNIVFQSGFNSCIFHYLNY
jgi:hypothetical protein